MLQRRSGESLQQLLERLDAAIELAWTADQFTNEINTPLSKPKGSHPFTSCSIALRHAVLINLRLGSFRVSLRARTLWARRSYDSFAQ
jgi:hypothetical protein